jgi:hypothetical protein
MANARPITPESPPVELHEVWRAAWWPVARAVAETGHDCTVLDPDAEDDANYHEGGGRGVISVRTHVGLGWSLIVSECEPDQEDDR